MTDDSLRHGKYRHEFKYAVNECQIEVIKANLENIMYRDAHASESSGVYNIRSVYFDDYYDSCFHENENGTDPREKYRIRIYNASTEYIALELKRKVSGMTQKDSVSITFEQASDVINNRFDSIFGDSVPLLNKFYTWCATRTASPKVIVEYDRVAYVYPDGNVRITFDRNIRSSDNVESFFDERIPERPVMPTGMHVMEVKYDEILPDFIYNAIHVDNLRQITFSKYYLSRNIV